MFWFLLHTAFKYWHSNTSIAVAGIFASCKNIVILLHIMFLVLSYFFIIEDIVSATIFLLWIISGVVYWICFVLNWIFISFFKIIKSSFWVVLCLFVPLVFKRVLAFRYLRFLLFYEPGFVVSFSIYIYYFHPNRFSWIG